MALDVESAKDTLFSKPKREVMVYDRPEENAVKVVRTSPPSKLDTMEKVNVLLTEEQKGELDRLAKKLMKFRSKEVRGNFDKERITANMIIRTLIDNLKERSSALSLEIIKSEGELKAWTSQVFK